MPTIKFMLIFIVRPGHSLQTIVLHRAESYSYRSVGAAGVSMCENCVLWLLPPGKVDALLLGCDVDSCPIIRNHFPVFTSPLSFHCLSGGRSPNCYSLIILEFEIVLNVFRFYVVLYAVLSIMCYSVLLWWRVVFSFFSFGWCIILCTQMNHSYIDYKRYSHIFFSFRLPLFVASFEYQ